MFFKIRIPAILIICLISVSCSTEQPLPEQRAGIPEADSLIREAQAGDLFTGAVLLIAEEGEPVHHKAYGFATLYDENLRVVSRPDSTTTDHIFDLASLTKIFATTYAMMALHSDGIIGLDDPIHKFLPEYDTRRHREITIRHLMNHTSGLVPWYPSYYRASTAAERRSFVAGLPMAGMPGDARRYSDFGFMLLADIIETVSGQDFEEYLNDRIYDRIGLQKTVFNPLEKGFDKIVSTSHGNPFEKKMVYDPGFGYRVDIDPESWDGWREYTLKGEVNDGNAWHANGGIAGHAGLFSTAEELYRLLQMVMNDGMYNGEQILDAGTIDLFTSVDEFGNGLGWAMDPSVLQADTIPSGTIGHTGFTGTNIILHPNDDGGSLYILLTNRQHVGVDEEGQYPDLMDLRRQLAALLFQ